MLFELVTMLLQLQKYMQFRGENHINPFAQKSLLMLIQQNAK